MANVPLFTVPKICQSADGDWYVYFRFFDISTGKRKLIKARESIMRYHADEKNLRFEALRLARFAWLKSGWNPITDPEYKNRPGNFLEAIKDFTFEEALDFAYEKKAPDWKHKSRISFSSVVTHLKKGAAYTGILHQSVTALKRPHYLELLERIRFTNKLSGAGFNKYRCYLGVLIDKIVAYDVLEYNPVDRVEKKKVVKTMAHRPPTKDQQLLIVAEANKVSRAYYRYLCVIYGCCIRPNEICHLKIKDLHRQEQIFRLVPEKNSQENAKAGARDTVIPDWLMTVLSEINLHNYDPECYLFSSKGQEGIFTPGKKKMHVNTTGHWWRKIVKQRLGLDVNQYGLKKLAGDDLVRLKRREGTDKLITIAQQQMGHSDAATTRIYTEEDEVINRELIKRKMPAL